MNEKLWHAIEVESRNRLRYLAFADKADAEGEHQLARLFRAIAESEFIHARAELKALGVVGSSTENVRAAAVSEEQEFQDLYALYLLDAQEEGNERAAAMFGDILKVERAHHRIFVDALAALLARQPLADEPIRVCETCGNTVIGKSPDVCEVCGSQADAFHEVQ